MINPRFIDKDYGLRMLNSGFRQRIKEIMKSDCTPEMRSLHPKFHVKRGLGSHHKIMLYRYIIASDMVKRMDVIDVACGLGWGSYIISLTAEHILGVDMNTRSIKYATRVWKEDNLSFRTMNVIEPWNFPDDLVDAMTMMEFIEHVGTEDLSRCLHEVYRIIRPGGLLIGSSGFTNDPDKRIEMLNNNPDHVQIYSGYEFKELLSGIGFVEPKIYFDWMFTARRL